MPSLYCSVSKHYTKTMSFNTVKGRTGPLWTRGCPRIVASTKSHTTSLPSSDPLSTHASSREKHASTLYLCHSTGFTRWYRKRKAFCVYRGYCCHTNTYASSPEMHPSTLYLCHSTGYTIGTIQYTDGSLSLP